MEDMNRKWRCVSLIVGLTLLVLPVSGCVQGDRKPEASTVAGRVVLAQEQAAGLAGVSLLVVDDTSSYVATDEEGYFETAALSGTVIIPRKTGYRFVPERQVVGAGQELEFEAHRWPEPDFANWGVRFSFADHLDWIEAIAFSPDDRYMATASNDRTIRI